MKLKLTKIESTHENTKEALNEVYNDILLGNTSLSLVNNKTGVILRTSSIKEIKIKTNNSIYTLERVKENKLEEGKK